jgi:hypothetical protein
MSLDDVDYLVEDVVISQLFISCAHLHLMSSKHSTIVLCIIRMFTYATASYRIAGGVAGISTGGAGLDGPAAAPGTGGPEEEEPGEELPEYVDHHPSSFERDKPRSILSLPFYKSYSLLPEL